MEQSKRISRKVISALLSLLMVFSCFSGMSLTAYGDNTETLLTTITATGKEQANYSTANVATVSFGYTAGGSSAYLANWGWWGYGWTATVNAAEGYTITKCVFYDDANRTATDSSSPFVVETTEEDKTPQVNGTPILAYTSKGIKKIEVYGYQTPSSAYADYLPAATDDATALAAKVVKFNGYDWYLIEDNSTSETEGTVTLFAKDTIGSSRFDNSNNVYSESMVKSYLDNLTAEGGAFADVADAIVPTDLEDVTVTGAKLWLLSKDEVITTYKLSTALNKCSNDWWLRTPATSSYLIYVNGESGSVVNAGNFHMNTYGVRPALNLDLSKVEFNSETKTFALPAVVTEYPLWVGGVLVTSENMSGEGWNYAADTNTLTLNGYTNSGTARADIQSGVNNAAIYYNDNMFSPNPLTIQLAEGTTNSLTMTGDRVYGIYVFGSALTITGNGTLNVQSDDMAINDAWGVAITGGTVNAASSAYYGIGSVTIGADISSVTITGKLGAIYGGSNEEQELINAVAGTGWTDTAGTTGKADIAISTTGQNVSSYKKVYFTPHTHDFTYSANGATITATCNGAGTCNLTDNKVSFTLTAPTSLVYNGTDKKATLEGVEAFNAATGMNVSANDIVYNYKAKSSDSAVVVTETKNAGIYQALYTLQTDFPRPVAGISFTIAKANSTYEAPQGLYATYGDTLADVALPDGWAWVDDTTSVGDAGTKTFKANFTPADTTNYNVVENVDVTVKVNPADITPTVTLDGWTYGVEANTPSVTGNAGNGDVAYTYAQKGSDNFSATVPTDTGNYTVKATIAATANYNGGTATADFTIAKADPTYTVPTGLTATYGDTLSGVTLPTGWAWVDSTQSVGNVGTNTFKANFTPADKNNFNTVSGIDVKVTVGKTAGKTAVISTDTMTYNSDSIYIEGVEGQEYIIVPKGTAVTDADWNTSVKPDPERDNWVFFDDLKAATEYEIYTRTVETETSNPGTAKKADAYTTLSCIGLDYDSTLVGATVKVIPEPETEGLTYKWYQDVATEDGEGAIHHDLTEIAGATGDTYTFRTEDIGKGITVKIFAGTSEVGEVEIEGPVTLTATVIFDSMGGSDVKEITDVKYRAKIEEPKDPIRKGFAFDGWYWDEEFETPFDFEKDVITWTETTLYAKWTPNDYKITSVTGLTGANDNQWTKGTKDGVVITVKVSGEDNSFDHFTGVKLDGKELVKDVDYTVEKGSTIVTLKPETLEKLSVGEHTVTVLFDNGEVNTDLTVKAANSGNPTSPQTGDNSHMGLWIAIMILSLCALATTLFIGKKKRVYYR